MAFLWASQIIHLGGSHPFPKANCGEPCPQLMGSDHGTMEHFFEFYWKLTWTLERWAKQCWFWDVSCGKWKPQRGSDWSHLWAKRTTEKKGKTNTDSGKHAKRLSQETGQQNVDVCGMATWGWAHSHGIHILSKANELKADLPTSKLSFQIPRKPWAETSCKALKSPLEICVEKLCSH